MPMPPMRPIAENAVHVPSEPLETFRELSPKGVLMHSGCDLTDMGKVAKQVFRVGLRSLKVLEENAVSAFRQVIGHDTKNFSAITGSQQFGRAHAGFGSQRRHPPVLGADSRE